MREPFTVRARLQSIRHALRGAWLMLRGQHNAWIHALASVLVVGAAFTFGLTRSEWALLVLAIVAVWTTEALNTALELLADAVSPEFHPLVGQAKDVAAGGVLITAMGAVVIGGLVFGPYVLALLPH